MKKQNSLDFESNTGLSTLKIEEEQPSLSKVLPKSQKPKDDPNLPKDKHNICLIIFFLYGIGSLLPWNAILTSMPFFIDQFPNYGPAFIFPFAVNGLLTVISILMILYGRRVPLIFRLFGGFMINALLMIILPFASKAFSETTSFIVCIILLLIFGVFSGTIQTTVFGLGGMLPFKYMGVIMFGNGISGISTNLIQCICLLTIPDDEFKSTLVYFILSALILVSCAIGACILEKNQFFRYFYDKAQAEEKKSVRRMSMAIDRTLSGDDSGMLDKVQNNQNELAQQYSNVDLNKTDLSYSQNLVKSAVEDNHLPSSKSQFKSFLILLKKSFLIAWQFLIALMFVFIITFTVFPGASNDTVLLFLAGIKNYNAWFYLIMVFLFNLFDTCGRFMGGQKKLQIKDKTAQFLSYSRVLFVVTFMLIAFNVPPSWLFGINADWFKIINMIVFAFSNGYVSTLCAVRAPNAAHDDLKESVGMFVSIFLTSGIFFGSILAIGVGEIVPPMPPEPTKLL